MKTIIENDRPAGEPPMPYLAISVSGSGNIYIVSALINSGSYRRCLCVYKGQVSAVNLGDSLSISLAELTPFTGRLVLSNQ